jgi:hypothetical protein
MRLSRSQIDDMVFAAFVIGILAFIIGACVGSASAQERAENLFRARMRNRGLAHFDSATGVLVWKDDNKPVAL